MIGARTSGPRARAVIASHEAMGESGLTNMKQDPQDRCFNSTCLDSTTKQPGWQLLVGVRNLHPHQHGSRHGMAWHGMAGVASHRRPPGRP